MAQVEKLSVKLPLPVCVNVTPSQPTGADAASDTAFGSVTVAVALAAMVIAGVSAVGVEDMIGPEKRPAPQLPGLLVVQSLGVESPV